MFPTIPTGAVLQAINLTVNRNVERKVQNRRVEKNTKSGFNDCYIAKYNSSGVCQWAEKIVANTCTIAVDGSGNAYVAGHFGSSPLYFNNGITLTNSGFNDCYIAKYNSSGECLWAEKIAGPNQDLATTIAVDASGNVYVAGDFDSPDICFNNGKILSKKHNDRNNVFITKYNSSGVCQWAEKIEGSSSDYASRICCDGSGNVYVAGHFKSPILIFNNGKRLSISQDYDAYITKYNSSGVCQWAEKIAGYGSDFASCIAVDEIGNVNVVGVSQSTSLIFNNSKILFLRFCFYGEIYIAKYNSSGVCQWAENIAGEDENHASCIAVDGSDKIYVSGYSNSTILSFNNDKSLTNSGSSDGFITKYSQNPECVYSADIVSLTINPNPASDYIEIALIDKEACLLATDIKIYNNFGECVSTTPSLWDTPSKKGNLRINISHLPNGIYFLKLGNYSKQFVVVR